MHPPSRLKTLFGHITGTVAASFKSWLKAKNEIRMEQPPPLTPVKLVRSCSIFVFYVYRVVLTFLHWNTHIYRSLWHNYTYSTLLFLPCISRIFVTLFRYIIYTFSLPNLFVSTTPPPTLCPTANLVIVMHQTIFHKAFQICPLQAPITEIYFPSFRCIFIAFKLHCIATNSLYCRRCYENNTCRVGLLFKTM